MLMVVVVVEEVVSAFEKDGWKGNVGIFLAGAPGVFAN